MSDERDQRNVLERFLGIFTEVRAGEGGLTLAMAFLVFLLLAAYYLMRPVRQALILQAGRRRGPSLPLCGHDRAALLLGPGLRQTGLAL